MEKKLYWIDDSFRSIQNMENGLMKLWNLESDNNIKNIILLFGDYWIKDNEMDEFTYYSEKKYSYAIEGIFKDCCDKIEQGKIKRDLFSYKKSLLSDCLEIINKKPKDEEDVIQKSKYDLFNKVSSLWEDNDIISDTVKYEETKKDVKLLIDKFNIPNNAYVAIDCILMSGDYERVKENKKIISMEIYNILSKCNENKCFMYSEYIHDVKLVSAWKQAYSNYYADYKNVPFFKRKKLKPDNDNGYDFIDRIREMVINGEKIVSDEIY